MKKMILFLIIIFPSSIWISAPDKLIIWNVGQGQWVTYKTDQHCVHIDFGGEYSPIERVRIECGRRKNILLLSHDDKDHLSFLWTMKRSLPSLCMLQHPKIYNKLSYFKNLTGLTKCVAEILSGIQNAIREIPYFQMAFKKFNKNRFSSVYSVEGQFRTALVPGDSTVEEERIWIRNILAPIHILILGHHGSRTSSGDDLLRRLPALKLAVTSARKKRYGHPHPTVVGRLRQKKIPLLETEKWGHISIEI